MSFVYIDEPGRVARLERALSDSGAFALDCEAAGFHRYTDRLCLVQITTEDGTDFILDPLAVPAGEVLQEPLEDPTRTVIMHGADYDMRLLDRDLGIRTRGLFDTQAAAALLGESGLGLASLLEKYLDVNLAKKYQRADWARRPLPDDMLEYAASDTRYLHRLADLLRDRLKDVGRVDWAEEEFSELETVRWEAESDEDPVTRVKAARDLGPREVTALREVLAWRDRVAREQDRAAFRIAHDDVLVEVATRRPRTVDELGRIRGLNGRLARDEGEALVERLAEVERLAPDQLRPYPRPERNGPGRPPPEVEELAERLKKIRNARAAELGLDRGTLLPNATLLEIARHGPGNGSALQAVPGLKKWQMDAVGDELLAVLTR